MSDASPQPVERPPERKKFSFRQVRLRTLFLLTAAAAVWLAHWNHVRQCEGLSTAIQAMRPLARELVVDDPTQIAVVKLEEHWYDENRWDIYLPPTEEFRLCIATEEIQDQKMTPASHTAALAGGRHSLELRQTRLEDKRWRTVVLEDDREILRVENPAAWNPAAGSTGGSQISQSVTLPKNQPAVLFRRRFTVETAPGTFQNPTGPTNGVLVWIERTAGE